MSGHRKKVRHFHEVGDLHELTFSCYRRMSLLANDPWRTKLSRCIDDACVQLPCNLAAFVYMPNHVHLLLWGIQEKEDVSRFLQFVKQPVSAGVRADLEAARSRLLERLIVRERTGKTVFRL